MMAKTFIASKIGLRRLAATVSAYKQLIMKAKHIIVLIGIVVVNSGCFTYKSYVPVNLKEVELSVPLSIRRITIEDKRPEISDEEDIKIPFMSGLKRKANRHYPKLSDEHKKIIESTIYRNFGSTSSDTANITVTINYACKEFEQTGISEIERVYLSTETRLNTESLQFISSAIDTFYYESMDASKKHFEKFYQTSLQNNIVRNIVALRNQYYKSALKESDCLDNTFSKTQNLDSNLLVKITGAKQIKFLKIEGEFKKRISQEWSFKIATDQEGSLTYIECLDKTVNKTEELRELMKYLYKLKINQMNSGNCWKIVVLRSK